MNATLLLILSTGLAAADGPLDPQLSNTAERTNPVTYEVDFSAVVTPPYHAEVLKVWLPLPQSDAGQEVAEGELTSFPMPVQPQIDSEPVFGNRFAYFEFDHPEGAQVIRHRFSVKVWELRWNVDPSKVEPPADWPSSFEPYLRSEDQAVVVNEGIRSLLPDITRDSDAGYAGLTSVMDWVRLNFDYDHVEASLAASSLHGLERRRGHCSDYHGFCAAMGRALGYPARVTYGINPFPKNSPSHCKLEAYLPPYGWVSFDVSETQRLVEAIQKAPSLSSEQKATIAEAANERFSRGFRDNTWFLQTKGTDYDLAPPAARRVAVVRTIYAEADGVPLADPDPADPNRREFGWMTVHKYTPDRKVSYPFKDWKSLEVDEQNP